VQSFLVAPAYQRQEGTMHILQLTAGAATALVLTSAAATAQLLSVVEVGAPAVNCVFNP
jgi:hypothetical protein